MASQPHADTIQQVSEILSLSEAQAVILLRVRRILEIVFLVLMRFRSTTMTLKEQLVHTSKIQREHSRKIPHQGNGSTRIMFHVRSLNVFHLTLKADID